jgi:hypothetical protein
MPTITITVTDEVAARMQAALEAEVDDVDVDDVRTPRDVCVHALKGLVNSHERRVALAAQKANEVEIDDF